MPEIPRRKILVIDDEEILTKTFSRLLQTQGYGVETASRAEEALAQVEEEDFDLVLCDVRMPGQDGVTTAKQIRDVRMKNGRGEIPLIFLTGYADIELERKARELKPLAIVFKPFDVLQLLNLISSQFVKV